jgi:hypothetical protein
MSWLYEQSTGYLVSPTGHRMEPPGYAGHGAGVNNPALENVRDIGPVPEGWYTMQAPIDSQLLGRYAIRLTPDETNEMYGRNGFFMHGDEIQHSGEELASDGCIVQCLATRQAAWNSLDHRLQVVQSIVIPETD